MQALKRALETMDTPLVLSRATSIELLMARTTRKKQQINLLKALANIRFKRNAAHLAHLLLARMRR
jgi:hypothetical protein